MRDAFLRTLCALAATDPRIMLITGDLGFAVLDEFRARFPRQFLNAGVAEQNMLGLATGLALEGRIVFTYSIGNFPILRCLEQIRNDAAYHDANVKIVSIGAGFSYGPLGMSHHATEDVAVARAIPGVRVVAPTDVWEVGEATRAIAALPGVVYLRLDKSAVPVSANAERYSFGKLRMLRQGSDVAILTYGGIVAEVLCAARALEGEGATVSVASVHTLKPLDGDTILSLAHSHPVLVTVEEHVMAGGLGSAVAELLADEGYLPQRFKRLAIDGRGFVSLVGSQQYLRQECGLDAGAIANAVRVLL